MTGVIADDISMGMASEGSASSGLLLPAENEKIFQVLQWVTIRTLFINYLFIYFSIILLFRKEFPLQESVPGYGGGKVLPHRQGKKHWANLVIKLKILQ